MFKNLLNKYYYLSIYIITKSNIVRQYRDSFLGILWTILIPTSQIIIYAIVMPKIMRVQMDNYVVMLVSNMLPWTMISAIMIQTPNSLISRADILKRCIITPTMFPIVDLCKQIYTFFISTTVMYSVCVLFYIKPTIIILAFPIYFVPFCITLACIAITLAIIGPYLKDLGDLMTVGMNFTFWLTPIVYPVNLFPEKYQWIFEVNPFYIMIRPLSVIVYQQRLPNFYETASLLMLMFIAIPTTYVIYRKLKRNFVYYL